jgi:hypothetical protein
MASLKEVPLDPPVASLAHLSLSRDGNPERLCKVCSLLDFNKAFFASSNYMLPATPESCGLPNRFCWDLYTLRRESECPFCKLVLEAVNLSKVSDGIEDGIVAVRRAPLYTKEKDATLSTLYFLSLASSVDDFNQTPMDTGYVIGVSKKHETLVLSHIDPGIREQYPNSPPGLVPFTTRREWVDRSGKYYDVSIRILDPEKVDINLITGWLQKCEKEHTIWCRRNGPSVDVVVGFRVIDVKIGMIVDASTQCRYLALSYVWGKVHEGKNYLSLKKGNYNDLEKPGVLFDSMKYLPDTVKDAILLCQKLDERYLWVDSLCIIQDSVEDKKNQIGNMDVIYQRALLTIVAAAGSDANAGLPGLRPDLPRIRAPTANIRSLDLVALAADGETDVNRSKWNSRAWTFQERILSTRILRFTSTSVAFEKMKPQWDYVHVFRERFRGCYAPLVRDYTKRQLTSQDDLLNAFKGIEVALSRALGPFYWGLPQHLLAQSLNWIATATSSDLARRSGFPSWSWAGWIFGDGVNANYTTILHGPLPIFIIFSDEARVLDWSSDWSKDPYIGIRPWHDVLLYPAGSEAAEQRAKTLNDTVKEIWNIPDGIPLSNLLFFWTSAVPLDRISRGERGPVLDFNTAKIVRQIDGRVEVGGQPYEEESEEILKRSEIGKVELIYLGLDCMRSGYFSLILVECVDKVAHRILPQLLFSVDSEDWKLAEPQSKLVALA